MSNDLITRPIRADEAAEAKRMVYAVAHPLMEPEISLEALVAKWDNWGILADMDDIQKSYFENGGVFLVTIDSGLIVGTGAFEHLTDEMCNVRRISLLPEYRGRGLGYGMMKELARRAWAMGYRKMTLWTNPFKLTRAVAFYHQMGFVDVPHPDADEDELWMEMEITPPA